MIYDGRMAKTTAAQLDAEIADALRNPSGKSIRRRRVAPQIDEDVEERAYMYLEASNFNVTEARRAAAANADGPAFRLLMRTLPHLEAEPDPEPAATSVPIIPHVGQQVTFPSKSAKSGWRKGTVMKVTGKRALIAYQFDYERERDQKKGLKFDPTSARTAWRKLTEIRI